ncbi:MAG TPA: hypothetical protein VJC16_07860 [Candidatus Nanoarchaeia archaeon]|nr:hypothetical protein [Candidatus Nanoarchaeia archaeon]
MPNPDSTLMSGSSAAYGKKYPRKSQAQYPAEQRTARYSSQWSRDCFSSRSVSAQADGSQSARRAEILAKRILDHDNPLCPGEVMQQLHEHADSLLIQLRLPLTAVGSEVRGEVLRNVPGHRYSFLSSEMGNDAGAKDVHGMMIRLSGTITLRTVRCAGNRVM